MSAGIELMSQSVLSNFESRSALRVKEKFLRDKLFTDVWYFVKLSLYFSVGLWVIAKLGQITTREDGQNAYGTVQIAELKEEDVYRGRFVMPKVT